MASVKNSNLNDKAKFLVNNIRQSVNKFIKDVMIHDCDNKLFNNELEALRERSCVDHAVAVITGNWLDWMQYTTTNKSCYVRKVTKSRYIRNKLSDANGDQKKMWRTLKEIVNGTKDHIHDFIEFDGVIKNDKYE